MNVAIITGGTGSEREVSLSSANNVQKILSISNDYIFDYPKDKQKIVDSISDIDVCIPLIHGEGGEDGEIQIFLQELNIPYIFSSPEVHKNCLDKRYTKNILASNDIRSAVEFSVGDKVNTSVFIKPVLGGSSIHTMKTSSQKEILDFINLHRETDFIIEEAIEGREFSVGVIENSKGFQSLAVIEIKPTEEFFNYDNKYNSTNLAQEVCPADISQELDTLLVEQALTAHKVMGCKHLSRSDFIVNQNNEIYFLEINTIPGMTENSLVPKELKTEGLSLRDLFNYWISEVV